ncbi:hypothetical protein KIPB_008224, partial [Kipferlia bialata]
DEAVIRPHFPGAHQQFSRFGHSVSLADGILVVGTPNGDYYCDSHEAGEAFVFVYHQEQWMQAQWLMARGGETADYTRNHYGNSVSLSKDKSLLVIGEFGWKNSSGRVHLYKWREHGLYFDLLCTIEGYTNNTDDAYGMTVATANNGVFAVGAPFATAHAGKVYIYQYEETSAPRPRHMNDPYVTYNDSHFTVEPTWLIESVQQQGFFGAALSLSEDGCALAVGSARYSVTGVPSGNTLLYSQISERCNASTESVEAFLSGEKDLWEKRAQYGGKSADDRFGSDVALNGDGTRLAVGARMAGQPGYYLAEEERESGGEKGKTHLATATTKRTGKVYIFVQPSLPPMSTILLVFIIGLTILNL